MMGALRPTLAQVQGSYGGAWEKRKVGPKSGDALGDARVNFVFKSIENKPVTSGIRVKSIQMLSKL